MSSYTAFSRVYDLFMDNIPYNSWLEYIKEIWAREGLKPKSVLDLACGTGNMTLLMARDGYDCIGVDISSDMLALARAKALSSGADILFLNQSMTNFELYGTVQAAVCMCDSINYVVSRKGLKRMLSLICNYLEPGGIFIFDIISRYKFENIIAGNSFSDVRKNAAYIMSSFYDKKRNINEYVTTFFIKSTSRYMRYDERHVQRAHSIGELSALIEGSGLSLRGIYGELGFDAPQHDTERIFFVCGRNE